MLYGKIYLDTIDGKEALVFVSLATADPILKAAAANVDNIAISPEAKAALSARLQRDCPTLRISRYFGDFRLHGDDKGGHGSFFFKPFTEENGLSLRILHEGDILALAVGGGSRREVLDYMIPCENDYLKTLDLHDSIDPAMLWERHFAAMRERGEMPTADAESIKRTPTAFLTEAQKSIIKQDYRAHCDRYSDHDRHYHGDFLAEKILDEMTRIYCKSREDVHAIVREATP